MDGRTLPIIQQLAYDFPGTDFDYTDTHLVVNGRKVRTFLTAGEIAPHDPAKPNSRSYYQLFCNIVYNQFHIEPTRGSYADILIIDEEEGRKAAIEKWFAEKRIAFLENDGEITAVKYEIEGDTAPLQQISYEEAVEVEPLGETNTASGESSGAGREEREPKRTAEEQAAWERKMAALTEEGERIKHEMQIERRERSLPDETVKKKRRSLRKRSTRGET